MLHSIRKCICLVLAVMSFMPLKSFGQKLTDFVYPMIGAGGHGHVFVGANVPFGAVQVGPQNFIKGWDWCSGYHYSDSIVTGFSQMHLSGTGGSDLGDLQIMPYTGPIKLFAGTQENHSSGYASLYSHHQESVRPGYYSVLLKDYGIKVELTATERVAFHKYHFPKGENANVIFNLKDGIGDHATDTYIKQIDAYTIVGYRMSSGWANDQRFFFAIKSDKPLGVLQIFDDQATIKGVEGKGKAIKGVVTLGKDIKDVQLKVGVSPTTIENALNNIKAEIPGWDFQLVKKQADNKWERELSKIIIQTKSKTDKRIFYTGLYHTMFDPMLFNDHNNDYRGTDKKIYKGAKFKNYTVFSLWDTYRALNPLYTIMQPEKVDDIIRSMLHIYQQQGKLPIWHLMGCESNMMPGVSGVQVVAEAYLKGFKGFDSSLAFEAVNKTMMTDGYGMSYDKALQYLPSDKVGESVAKALEYGVSNGSVALMAKKMGRDSAYAYYSKRRKNYLQYYDSATGFFRGKQSNGQWNPVFDPVKFSHPWIDDLSEGNSWEYLWLVPEDVNGLIHLLGGEQRFEKRLDSLFTIQALHDPKAPLDVAGLIGLYAQGNEPGHHIAYLYNYIGKQWKTAEKIRYILQNLYTDKVDGLSGNEDCGQMSAWYIFSSLGFYPVFPADGKYAFGSPIFDKATLQLPKGKKFVMITQNNSPENKYIQSVRLNGMTYKNSYITHEQIVKGGKIEFVMGPRPNKSFGSTPAVRPATDY